eukprot:jgi/Botrbrau1/12188/Bobra.0186s0095.1
MEWAGPNIGWAGLNRQWGGLIGTEDGLVETMDGWADRTEHGLWWKQKMGRGGVGRAVWGLVEGGDLESVAILAPYSSQVDLLLRLLSRIKLRKKVTVSTVDAYQGREADAVVITTVRRNEVGSLGFVTDERRLNVAITRPRRGLVLIGSPTTLSADPNWWRYLRWLRDNNAFMPASVLPLTPFEEEGGNLAEGLDEAFFGKELGPAGVIAGEVFEVEPELPKTRQRRSREPPLGDPGLSGSAQTQPKPSRRRGGQDAEVHDLDPPSWKGPRQRDLGPPVRDPGASGSAFRSSGGLAATGGREVGPRGDRPQKGWFEAPSGSRRPLFDDEDGDGLFMLDDDVADWELEVSGLEGQGPAEGTKKAGDGSRGSRGSKAI